MIDHKHKRRLHSYWLFTEDGEPPYVSVWQIIEVRDQETHHSSDDIVLKYVLETRPGQDHLIGTNFPYDSKSLNQSWWKPILKNDIPLHLLRFIDVQT